MYPYKTPSADLGFYHSWKLPMSNSIIKKLINYAHPYRWSAYQGIGALLVVNLLSVYIPFLIRDGIDQLKTNLDYGHIIYLALLVIGLASIAWVVRMVSRLLIFGLGRRVQADLKQRIFEHVSNLDTSYFITTTVGDLISRSTSDVENIMRLMGFSLLSIFNIIFAYAFTLPAMLSINVRLTLLALSIYPVMLLTVKLFSGRLRQEQVDVQERLSDLSELIQEDMSGITLIKIYAQEESERRAFAEQNKAVFDSNLRLAQSRNTVFPIIQGLASISLLMLLWQGSQAIASGEIQVGGFLALIIYAQNLIFPTALLGFTITAFQRGEVSIDRVEAIMTAESKIFDTPQSIDPGRTLTGKIEARQLTFTYPGAKVPALKNVNFKIDPGERVAIVGPIGAGKSTLVNVLPRLLNVQAGQLFIDGFDVTDLTLESLRRSITYVPQESFLFSTSIANNIRYGDPVASEMAVVKAAQQSQIHPEIVNFPQQYETLVGERGITLSGGQRQRTSLARALLVDAPILILDDALSSVDNQTATAILENLAAGTQKKTVIFVSHQLSAAAMADRILVMDRGEIVQSGSHQDLIDQEGLYRWLWSQNQLAEMLS
jgi:ATP-binding cassette, subfamily B, multidrug efflux pump